MKLFTIFGNPVSHSKSPLMHNSGFKNLNINSCYTKTALPNGDILKDKFLSLKLQGANITVPFKEDAYKLVDEVRGDANDIKAVNTIILEKNKLIGFNTDGAGFYETIKDLNITDILILGAGGTAKAIATVLNKKDKFNIEILNRGEERLKFFIENSIKSSTWSNFQPKKYDLIINTTSAGLSDNNLPISEKLIDILFTKATYAIDIIYGKKTAFLKQAEKYGLNSSDGANMLLMQGVLAFDIFTEKKFKKDNIKEYLAYGLKL